MVSKALAIMFKAPEAGKVKTRLVPPLTYGEAAGLYKSFLDDTFSKALALSGTSVYGFHAGDCEGIVPSGIIHIPQRGQDLGERMFNAFGELFSRGYGKAVMIGSDSPDLPTEYIDDAFRLLDGNRAVLGPAMDGGYYLIGLERPQRALFEGIPWSTPEVLEKTLEAARRAEIPTGLLSPWHDMDGPEDLRLLDGKGAPCSWKFLKGLEAAGRISLKG